MRQRNLGYERQDRDFYPTAAWVTEALRRRIRLPNLGRLTTVPACGRGDVTFQSLAGGGRAWHAHYLYEHLNGTVVRPTITHSHSHQF
jgi:hypothetical protein